MNAANSDLAGGGDVDGAIHRAAAALPRELRFVFFSAADAELFRGYAAGREPS